MAGLRCSVQVDTVAADAPIGPRSGFGWFWFSHGIPALLCFLRGSWWPRCAVPWPIPCRTVALHRPVVCLVQVPFYGMANQNLAVAFYAVAFALALTERELGQRGLPWLPAPGQRPVTG